MVKKSFNGNNRNTFGNNNKKEKITSVVLPLSSILSESK